MRHRVSLSKFLWEGGKQKSEMIRESIHINLLDNTSSFVGFAPFCRGFCREQMIQNCDKSMT